MPGALSASAAAGGGADPDAAPLRSRRAFPVELATQILFVTFAFLIEAAKLQGQFLLQMVALLEALDAPHLGIGADPGLGNLRLRPTVDFRQPLLLLRRKFTALAAQPFHRQFVSAFHGFTCPLLSSGAGYSVNIAAYRRRHKAAAQRRAESAPILAISGDTSYIEFRKDELRKVGEA